MAQQFVFGTGTLVVQALGGTNPIPIAALTEVSVDISADLKELNGSFTYPLAVARGKSKIQCKATTAAVDVVAFNQFFFGGSVSTTNTIQAAVGEAHTIPSTATYYVAPTNSANFVDDLGVTYTVSGLYLTQVLGLPTSAGQYTVVGPVAGATCSFATNVMTCTVAPTSGQFAVGQVITATGVTPGTYISSLGTGTGGVGTYNLSSSPGTIAAEAVSAGATYMFYSADAGKAVQITYNYSAASTGHSLTVSNQLMGSAPTFQCNLIDTYNGASGLQQVNLVLYACVAQKLSMPLKADDFLMNQLEFSAMANAAGNVFTMSTSS